MPFFTTKQSSFGGAEGAGVQGGWIAMRSRVSKDWDLVRGFVMQVPEGRAKAKALRSLRAWHVGMTWARGGREEMRWLRVWRP